MALQQRLSRELANLLLSTPSYLNRPQVQRSRLQLFSSLLSRDIDSSEKKRRREDDCPSTKRTSIKQDVGSPTLAAAVSSLIGDKPYGVLLSALVCRLPDKLIRDVMPAQGPWSPQRAPEQQKSNCPVFDDPCGESSCSFDPRAEKTLLSTGLYPRNWSRLQTRGLHASALKCGVGRGHSNGKSNRNKSQKAAKKPNNSKTRKGPREKKPSDQKFTSCEPDVGWKRHKCLGDSRGSDTCSVDKPQCTEKVGPTYRELEKSHEDKRMKAWKQSKSSSSDKCQPDDSWKESKTCTKSSESCSTGKPQCGGGKRSYSTLPRILLNFQSTRSLMSGGGLSRECNSGGGDNKDKSIGDVFKKEMQEIEECIAAAKCKIPMPKTDKSNGEGNSTKKGKK